MENTENTIAKRAIINPPIRDEFTLYGDKFEKVAYNDANGMYCYKRTPLDGVGPVYYEVFKARKAKGENGNEYDRYPWTTEFGSSALCIRGDGKHTDEKIAFYMTNGFNAGRYKAE